MTPGGLTSLLDIAADECRDTEVPADPFDADALHAAAMRASSETLALAKRIRAQKHRSRWERHWARRYRDSGD